MKYFFGEKPVVQPVVQKNEEEKLLDELDDVTKDMLDMAKRQSMQIKDSVELTKKLIPLTEKQTDRMQNLAQRAEVESHKSTFCTLF